MRIALAGAGAFGAKHLDGLAVIDGVTVTSVVSRRLEQAEEVARKYGAGHASTDLDEVLAREDVDAVILCTPTQLHARQAIAAMRAGKHVQVEIPLADSWADAQEVDRTAQATGLVCMVGHTRRFNPSHQWIRHRIAAGELSIQQMDVQTYFFRRKNLNALGEPRSWTDHLLWHHAAHTVDLFQYQTGEDIQIVHAVQGPIHPELGIAIDMSIQLLTTGGRICTLSLSFNNDGPLGTFFRYICDNGTYIARYDDLVTGREEPVDVSGVDVSTNGIELQDREFVAAIREGREPAPLHAAGAFTREVNKVVGRPLTFGQSWHLVALREAADSARQRLTMQHAAFHDVCGDLYAGAETDVAALRAALDWARRLRAMITGGTAPLTPAHLKAAESAVPTAQLAAAADAWRQARDALMAAFGPDRRQELAAELDDYEGTAQLLEAMFDDTSGPDEWHAYQAARASLAAYGLDTAVDFCIAEHVEPAQVPRVIELAILQEWAEHHLTTDPALATVRAADRAALVREYQELDGALLAAATGDIIRACNARRPRGDTGEAAVIREEAEKKRDHLPVRVLIERARHVCQALKPCFLMSSPTVSQYLPPGLHFDVVIVDEASQDRKSTRLNSS